MTEIKPEQVPPGLALIARKAWAEGVGPTNDDDWNAAIAAAINAWPGIMHSEWVDWEGDDVEPTITRTAIILPLPQEASDE